MEKLIAIESPNKVAGREIPLPTQRRLKSTTRSTNSSTSCKLFTAIIIVSPTNAAPNNLRHYWANLDRAPAHDRMIVRIEYDVDD